MIGVLWCNPNQIKYNDIVGRGDKQANICARAKRITDRVNIAEECVTDSVCGVIHIHLHVHVDVHVQADVHIHVDGDVDVHVLQSSCVHLAASSFTMSIHKLLCEPSHCLQFFLLMLLGVDCLSEIATLRRTS